MDNFRLRSGKSKDFKTDVSELSSNELREVFDLFDNDGNQSITYHEINRLFIALDDKQSAKKIKKMIKKVDKNKDGELDFEEFVQLLGENLERYQRLDEEYELKEVFDILDKNGDGSISPSELFQVMSCLGTDLTYNEVENLFKEVDMDQNGLIDYEEFKTMLTFAPQDCSEEPLSSGGREKD